MVNFPTSRSLACAALLLTASAAAATETITYTYDAKGQLVKGERSGGVTTRYAHDKADNRSGGQCASLRTTVLHYDA